MTIPFDTLEVTTVTVAQYQGSKLPSQSQPLGYCRPPADYVNHSQHQTSDSAEMGGYIEKQHAAQQLSCRIYDQSENRVTPTSAQKLQWLEGDIAYLRPAKCFDEPLMDEFLALKNWTWYLDARGQKKADAATVRNGQYNEIFVSWEYQTAI